jgi:hypothetical protein
MTCRRCEASVRWRAVPWWSVKAHRCAHARILCRLVGIPGRPREETSKAQSATPRLRDVGKHSQSFEHYCPAAHPGFTHSNG